MECWRVKENDVGDCMGLYDSADAYHSDGEFSVGVGEKIFNHNLSDFKTCQQDGFDRIMNTSKYPSVSIVAKDN